MLFAACLTLLSTSMRKLHEELDRQMGTFYLDLIADTGGGDGLDSRGAEGDGIKPLYDMTLGVRLAEAAAQVKHNYISQLFEYPVICNQTLN